MLGVFGALGALGALVVHGVLGVLCVLSALGMRPDTRVEVWLVANSLSGLQPTV